MAGANWFLTNTQDASLTNAGTLVTATGSPATANPGLKVGQLTGFGQWNYVNNSTLFTPLSSLPLVANGKGWLLDAAILNLKGQQIPGTALWAVVFRGLITVGTATVDSYLVYYVYNTILQTYTLLGSQVKTGGSWSTSASNHSVTGATISGFPTMLNFGNGDTLYVEPWFNVTSNNSGSNNASLQLTINNSATQGNASSTNFSVSVLQAIPAHKNTGSGFYRESRFTRERIAAYER